MLHEIEGVERDIRGKEDLVLQDMEQAETLQAAVKTEEREYKVVESRHAISAKELDGEAKALEATVAKLRAERDAVLAQLSTDTRELYERVAKKRGSGVAEARDAMCQQCHLKLRPQMYVDLKRRDQILQCPGCQRILFYEPPPPEVTGATGGCAATGRGTGGWAGLLIGGLIALAGRRRRARADQSLVG